MRRLLLATAVLLLVAAPTLADADAARRNLEFAKGNWDNDPRRSLEFLDRAEKELEGVDDATKAPIAKEIAESRAKATRKVTEGELNGIGHSLERTVENLLKDPAGNSNWDSRQINQGLDDIDERIKKLPQDDPDVKAMGARLAKDRVDWKAFLDKYVHDEAVGPAIKYWAYVNEQASKWEGWEQEKTAPPIADVLGHSPMPLGFEKSESLAEAVTRFLEDERVRKAVKDYASDAELKKIVDEATAKREKAESQICAIANATLAELEKMPASDRVKSALGQLREYHIERHTKHCPEHAKTLARAEALAKKWEAEETSAKNAKDALQKKLIETANAVWPDYEKNFEFTKIDPLDAVANPGNWNGKTIHFHTDSGDMNDAGSTYEAGGYDFITEVNGLPVCCRFDPALNATWKAKHEATGIWPDESGYNDIVAVVEGVGAVQKQTWSEITKRHYPDVLLKAPIARVVAFRTQNGFAASCGVGTNLDEISGIPHPECGGSSSGGSGGLVDWYFSASTSSKDGFIWHMLKRLLSYFAALVTFLGGLLAFAWGASRFVPQIAEPLAKLGDNLGKIGAGFAVFAVVWLFATLILWDLLPAGALFAAGAFTALDLAKRKEKIAAETVDMIQPLGIALGLAAMGLAGIHVLLWNWPLL